MTVQQIIDLTVPTPRRHGYYEPIIDARLPHQLTLAWGHRRATTVASCNCGVVLGEESPSAEPIARFKAAYDEHVRWLR